MAVPLNPLLSLAEVKGILSQCGASTLVTDYATFNRWVDSRDALPVTHRVQGQAEAPLEGALRFSPGREFPPPARIDAASWLEGDWVGQGLGGTSEEAWLAPFAGSMGGVYRGTRDGRVTFLELMTLVQEGPSLLFRLKHFAPDLRGWEPKDKTVDFPLVRSTPGALFLDGMTYRRIAEGLESWVVIGQTDGGVRPERFLYRPRAPE